MVRLGLEITGLLLARVVTAQSFANTSTAATGNSSTAPCPYSPSDCAARSSVLSCQALHTSWVSSRNSYVWSGTTTSSVPTAYKEATSVSFTGNYTGPLSTFCDGVPRGGKAPAITLTSTYTYYEYLPRYSIPEPTCTYDYNACALLISEYRDAPRGPTASEAPQYPACAWDTEECINPAGAVCPIHAGEVKLIYWPQSKDPSKLCASSTSPLPASITPAPSVPLLTTKIGNYTLTSPTVYLSFKSIEALLCWKVFTDVIVPVTNLNDLSSMSFTSRDNFTTLASDWQDQPSFSTMSINWDDLNPPVPMSAYKGQQSCWVNWDDNRAPVDRCSTIYDDYNPWLVLPTNPLVYTDIDPRFKNCTSIQYSKYVIDPPLALTTAGLLVPEPSSPALTSKASVTAPASDPASPAPGPAPPTVTATTARPTPTIQPTTDPEDSAEDPSDDAPVDAPADHPADAAATTEDSVQGGGGGLGPIISQLASSVAAGQPNDPTDSPAAPSANTDPSDDDPTAPTDPAANNENDDDNSNNGDNAPHPVVTIIPVEDSTALDLDQPDGNGSGSSSGGGGSGNPDVVVIASPANDPANPGAVLVVAGSADASDAAAASTTMTRLPGATGFVPGAGSVAVAVPSTGGAVVVGGTETFPVPSAAADASAAAVVGGGSDGSDGSDGGGDGGTGMGGLGAVISGSDGAGVTAVPGTANGAGGSRGGSVVVVGGVTVTPGSQAVTVPGVGVVSAVSGGNGGVVVNGDSTAAFSTLATGDGGGEGGSGGSAAVLTLGGEVETVSSGSGGLVVVDGKTLTVGGAAATRSDGMVVSAATGAMVVDGTTMPFGSVRRSTSSGATGAAATGAADDSSSTVSGTADGDSALPSNTSSRGAAPALGDGKMRTVLALLLPLIIF